jgi:hypothetical protein
MATAGRVLLWVVVAAASIGLFVMGVLGMIAKG